MPTYAVLQNPGHNRVYFNASRSLSIRELSLTLPVCEITEDELGGVPYLIFTTENELNEMELRQLSRLSFVYAIFLLQENKTLIPQKKDSAYFFNDDISMILKYTGKTNELFTRFMLNIAIRFIDHNPAEQLRILDPICGKGTTLFEGLMLKHHVAGIEIEEKLAYESFIFYKRYLETAKVKHSSHTEKAGGQDSESKKFTATRHQVKLTKDLIDFEVIAGNTLYANTYYKKNTFHAIVGDLPYGVQHGTNKTGKQKNITRNAMGMLTDALPEWLKVLKPGGVVALAWNLFLIPRAEMEELLSKHGLRIPEETREGFTHRVDQAINRDVIIGVKP